MAQKKSQKKQPPQRQSQPGRQHKMKPQPQAAAEKYRPAGRLAGKVALITGGDSGIGRAVAAAMAKEGADVCISYLSEHDDARETVAIVERAGRQCIAIPGDIGDSNLCRQIVQQCVRDLGRLDILVNNAAEQHVAERPEDISDEQIERTFRTNIFAMFYLVREALAHMKPGSSIVNSASVTAYRGNPALVDYASTKGAIVAFTRSLALALAERGIRVNAVAPGETWTPLIPATFPAEKVESFGGKNLMGRPAEPDEVAPCYVFLASDDAVFMTGQVLHPNGGEIVNG